MIASNKSEDFGAKVEVWIEQRKNCKETQIQVQFDWIVAIQLCVIPIIAKWLCKRERIGTMEIQFQLWLEIESLIMIVTVQFMNR